MPLPQAPSQLGDILTDYGPEAKPKARAKKSRSSGPTEKNANLPQPSTTEVSQRAAKAPALKKATPKASQKASPAKPNSKAKNTKAKSPELTLEAAPAPSSAKAQRVAKAKALSRVKAPSVAPTATPAQKSKAAKEKAPVKTVEAPSMAKPTDATDETNLRRIQGGASSRLSRRAMLKEGPKLFVLDTNVLMHDPLCLFHFDEHDVFIPMIVLEELDNHKTGVTDVARNARSVSRSLDQLTELHHGPLDQGIPLSLLGNTEASGRLFIETHPIAGKLPAELPITKADNLILATAKGAESAFADRTIVLVRKDINMRIKASVLGIATEDYLSDKVIDDTEMIYSGRLELPVNFWQQVEDSLQVKAQADGTRYLFDWPYGELPFLNQCLTVSGDPDFMGAVSHVQGRRVEVRILKDYIKGFKAWGIHARNAEQNMALNLLMDPNIDFVTILGQAGTGKTLLTLATALVQTMDQNRFSEIIITRATVSVGDDIGYLPGTEEEKMAPWMGALEDNLEVLQSFDSSAGEWARKTGMDLLKNRIRVKSMSFMRGRTFLKKFLIIDEAQNLSPKQIKTLITRAGPGTKIVCLGNLAQIDTPYLTEGSSGLTYVVDRFKNWEHAATITLARGERSRLAEYAVEVL